MARKILIGAASTMTLLALTTLPASADPDPNETSAPVPVVADPDSNVTTFAVISDGGDSRSVLDEQAYWNTDPDDGTAARQTIDPKAATGGECIGGHCIPYTTYAACGAFDDSSKEVTDRFYHNSWGPQMTTIYAHLRCGTDLWGFNHIRDRHYQDFQNKADLIGRNWRDFFDWAARWALKDPDRVTWQSSREAFCFDRKFAFVVDDEVIMSTRILLVTNAAGGRIITAWPSSNSRCSGTRKFG